MEDFARDVLLKKKWGENSLENLSIVIISRGYPGDRREIDGREVEHIGRSYFNLEDGASIPYHRVVEIHEDGRLIWSLDMVSDRLSD